jgi:hypothetical protein
MIVCCLEQHSNVIGLTEYKQEQMEAESGYKMISTSSENSIPLAFLIAPALQKWKSKITSMPTTTRFPKHYN